MLHELFPQREAELVARYEKDALERLRTELGTVRERFAAILDVQPNDETLWRLLRPGYPNLVPRHGPETLGSALQALVLGLGAFLRDSPVNKTWTAAVGELLDEQAAEKKVQDAIALAAKQVSEEFPAAASPFAAALREMLPDHSYQALATLLTWAARPRTPWLDSQPWVEEVVAFPECIEQNQQGLLAPDPCLGAVTCIYWPR